MLNGGNNNMKERNNQIYKEYQNRYKTGEKPVTLRELGNKYDLTHERIRQIVAEIGENKIEKATKLYPSVFNQ